MTEQPVLVLEHVTVGYGRTAVLPDVNAQLRRGTFAALVGANGTGKSTLLKTILGIIPPLRGRIALNRIEGRAVTMGYMPQRETLDPIYPLSSLEVVLMAACSRVRPAQMMPRSEREFALQCLAETGATDLAAKLFSQLSGGQKQRVLMARALATRPEFLLLDEPTAGIDATATQAIMDVLQRIHVQRRLTILLVSHDLMTVRQCAKEIIWLHEGKAVQGPASELMTRDMIGKVLSFELA